jgi:hypothetical protein|tara:strand:- start:537 stop:1115 length:579 start_codon:yes stop_codon:yes gene_type:complete
MTPRARNNTIAGFLVVAFWLILVIPTVVQAVDESSITQNTTSTVTTTGTNETTVNSPPPSAISPNVGGNNSDLCTISSSGALGTQILSLSLGATYTEENCLRLKKAGRLYDMGMKVAAVSIMCQDKDVWQAMMDAGTPCPIDGLIGNEAKAAWQVRTDLIPMPEDEDEITAQEKRDKVLSIMGTAAAAFIFF